MQYKSILLIFLSVFSLKTVNGQQYQSFSMPAKTGKIIKTDTVVNKMQPVEAHKNAATPELLVTSRKPVPLAGHKTYFGSMNDYVEGYVLNYIAAHNKTLCVVQGRGNDCFSDIDEILEEHDIPKELKYLAVIESALNRNAISRAGAVGPWQFMAGTARLMGLNVSKKRDERRDWDKSTNAAAKYLSFLYDQLNDWLLVVAAYNSGPAPVLRAIERTGSNNFWDIKKYLPRETQGHVLAFIATATIFENMSKFIGLNEIPSDFVFTNPESRSVTAKPVVKKLVFSDEEIKSMAIVRITEPLNMDLVAQDLKIDKKQLEKWNPDYDLFVYENYSEDYYSFRIPKDKLDNFISRKDFLTKRSKQIFSEMRF